jgi:hypothetical protein
MPIDTLPLNLNGYLASEETLNRMCQMVPGDAVLVFQDFMVRFHEIISLSHLPLPQSADLSKEQVSVHHVSSLALAWPSC